MRKRLPKYPTFRWTFRKNCIINDIESRNFLGIYQEGEIVISLSAIIDELREDFMWVDDELIIRKISLVITHEYLHHVLFKLKHMGDHHWAIYKMLNEVSP